MLYSPFAVGMLLVLMSTGCQTGWNPLGNAFVNAPAVGQETGAQDEHPGLRDPAQAAEKAPDKFVVKLVTTKGDILLECNREWSANGADRFYNLCKVGYFKDIAIFRAVPNFMFQFGIHGTPEIAGKWSEANIKDDQQNPNVSNQKGYITFAKTSRPNTRSTQMFINLTDNSFLDSQGFTPFGKVIEGMDVVDKINTEYGENRGNVQGNLKNQGNEWLKTKFPNLDYIKSVTIVK